MQSEIEEGVKNSEKKMEDLENIDDAKLKDIVENKDVAAASYFLVLSPILLLTRKDSEFIQHHSRQSLALFFIFILLWFLGTFFIIFAWTSIGVFFIALVGFIQAINGKYYEVPYIYEFVKNGYSVDLFKTMFVKIFTGLKEIILGLFPKNSFVKNDKIANTSENSNNKNGNEDSEIIIKKLTNKIEELEKKFQDLENKK